MANYSNLKAAIAAAIKQNGNQEITGQVLQDVLTSMVSVIGANYTFAGVATPATNPGTPDQNVFYLAMEGGTYTNFNGTVLLAGISLLMWNGTWTSKTVMCGDGGVFDISVYKSSGGTLATFADLAAALDGGNNIPASARNGGMSVKFVQSSDNKYVQYRLMTDEWSTDTDDWAICEDTILVENPEFIAVYTDKNGRIVKAARNDGTEMLGAGLEVHGNININGTDITMTENPEFVAVWLDKYGKILFGVQKDANFLFGAGVPKQIVDYIESRIKELSLDEYEDIVAFLNDLEKGDKTLQNLLDEKVDKEERKSLIDEEYASSQSAIDNPEFLEVTTDSEDKVLEGFQQDGTKFIGADLKVGGNTTIGGYTKILGYMEVSGVLYNVIENPEYLAAWVDTEGKVIFGLKADGKIYVGDAYFLNEIKDNQEAINEIKSYLANLDIDALSSIAAVENPEFIEAKTDSEGKLIAGRTPDGAAFENVGLSTPQIEIAGVDITDNVEAIESNTVTEDYEDRSQMTTDSKERILSYRDKDGVLHEEKGITTPLNFINDIEFTSQKSKHDVTRTLKPDCDYIKSYKLPDNGEVNIINEKFYLTANEGYTDESGIYPIQVYENTAENAILYRTCQKYYVKSSLTDNGDGTYSVNDHSVPLDFYIPKNILAVSGHSYVKSTLTKVVDPETGDVTYTVNENSVEVTEINLPPNLQAWAVNKDDEHQCIVKVDFGDYFSGTFYVGVKFQGASTLRSIKRNLRFTYYKNGTYSKKVKIKIGEMIRQSSYNLKAYTLDATRLREPLLNRLFEAMWEKTLNLEESYPWIVKEGYYTEATGLIKSFPIKVEIGGEFYGLYHYCLKKDEKNYMLDGDDDTSGIFTNNYGGNWDTLTSYYWDDEMGADGRELAYPNKKDSLSVESARAIDIFIDFVRGNLYADANHNEYKFSELTNMDGVYYVTSTLTDNGDGTYSINENSIACTDHIKFTRENARERMSVPTFIDYLIGMQAFNLWDNVTNNIILYSGRDKKKFYIYFYDLNTSFYGNYNDSAYVHYGTDGGPLWNGLLEEFGDDICNRYFELRKSILNLDYIRYLYEDAYKNIPKEWFEEEGEIWGTNIKNFSSLDDYITQRFKWLDEEYFHPKN